MTAEASSRGGDARRASPPEAAAVSETQISELRSRASRGERAVKEAQAQAAEWRGKAEKQAKRLAELEAKVRLCLPVGRGPSPLGRRMCSAHGDATAERER